MHTARCKSREESDCSLLSAAASRVGRQSCRQVIEQQSDSSTAAQIAVHDNPDIHRKYEISVEYRHEVPVAPRDPQLTCANSNSRAHRGELGEIAIGSKREHIWGEVHTGLFEHSRVCLVAIMSNQGVLPQIPKLSRDISPLQIAAVGIKSDVYSTNLSGHQRPLCRSEHPDGDVRLTA